MPDSYLPAGAKHIGNISLLKSRKIALFCSSRCPGMVILHALDLARELRSCPITVISGFHSSMEKECLAVFLRSGYPVIFCPSRSIERIRLPIPWKKAIEAGKMLILSTFSSKFRRSTKKLSEERNRFVASIADEVIIIHASQGGKIESLALEIVESGKKIFTLESPTNKALIEIGAKPFLPADVEKIWGVSHQANK